MYRVSLCGVNVVALVGVYDQEKLTGNELEIDLHVSTTKKSAKDSFIDYAKLHEIILHATQEPTGLLEQLIDRIKDGVRVIYPGVYLKIVIRKLNPPLGGAIAFSEVTWESDI